jgi:hypothetical protein
MKIGIFTLPLHTNYGGILQAYALQKVLRDMGHEAWLINRERNFKLPLSKAPFVYLRRLIRKYLLFRKDAVIFLEKKKRKEYSVISVNVQKFIKQNMQPIMAIMHVNDIPKNFFDVIIVGSDQIWRPRYNKPKIENAFLDFTKKWNFVKRIAYAASFGTSNWEYSKLQTNKCRKLIRKFDAISVREASGINLCKEHFNVDAQLVLDPVMLLDALEYVELAKKERGGVEGELFVYILDSNKEKHSGINIMSQTLNYKAFYASTDNSKANLDKRITIPVEEWLKSFFLAKFIVTDSFHACIFSVLLNKPFIVYGNLERGLSRIQSLLKLFELEDRLIINLNDLSYNKINATIDWEKTNRILEEYREKSLQFLKTNLE